MNTWEKKEKKIKKEYIWKQKRKRPSFFFFFLPVHYFQQMIHKEKIHTYNSKRIFIHLESKCRKKYWDKIIKSPFCTFSSKKKKIIYIQTNKTKTKKTEKDKSTKGV